MNHKSTVLICSGNEDKENISVCKCLQDMIHCDDCVLSDTEKRGLMYEKQKG
jgi:hypothetical protein